MVVVCGLINPPLPDEEAAAELAEDEEVIDEKGLLFPLNEDELLLMLLWLWLL